MDASERAEIRPSYTLDTDAFFPPRRLLQGSARWPIHEGYRVENGFVVEVGEPKETWRPFADANLSRSLRSLHRADDAAILQWVRRHGLLGVGALPGSEYATREGANAERLDTVRREVDRFDACWTTLAMRGPAARSTAAAWIRSGVERYLTLSVVANDQPTRSAVSLVVVSRGPLASGYQQLLGYLELLGGSTRPEKSPWKGSRSCLRCARPFVPTYDRPQLYCSANCRKRAADEAPERLRAADFAAKPIRGGGKARTSADDSEHEPR